MTSRLGVGFPLHADEDFLALTRQILEDDADWFEVSPETLWREQGGRIVPNGFHAMFREIREWSGKPFVAHGLAFSLGTPLPGDETRTEAWLARLRADHEAFRFEWLSDHLGYTVIDGLQAVLPLPLPFTPDAVAAVAARMRRLASVVPTVAFENPVTYFAGSDPVGEPDFLNAIARAAPCSMVLDLHNVHCQAANLGQDPADYVDRLDLDKVVELHVSGGRESEASWLPSRRVFRLDSHDGPVPEAVWSLLERVLPKCRNARGLLVERLNGTVDEAGLPALRDEVRRAKDLFPC